MEEVSEVQVNIMGDSPMHGEFEHGNHNTNAVNIENVVGPSGNLENVVNSLNSNEVGGDVLDNGVGPFLSEDGARGGGAKDVGLNMNWAFKNGVGHSPSKSGGQVKRVRGPKKKNGGSTKDISVVISGEPKNKKRRREEEEWSFTPGCAIQVDFAEEASQNHNQREGGSQLDLNVGVQEEGSDRVKAGLSSSQLGSQVDERKPKIL
ncbi:hypothetical protein Hanom_Chr01g00006881 [Helianthus anomalus]